MEGKYHTARIHHNGVAYEGHGKTEKAAKAAAMKRLKKVLGASPKAEELKEETHEMYGPLPRSLS